MTRSSFLPASPAFEADPVGDDADEDEDHPDEDDEMGEVLPQREGPEPGVCRVREVVLDEVEEQSEGDHDRAELRGAGDRRGIRRGRRGRRLWGGGIDRHGHRSDFYR
jgi:hypothetical protein